MTRRFLPKAAAMLLGFTVAVAPAVAQGPETGTKTFGERIDVELVNVDVWVSDAKGNPIVGLKPADFKILHDGEAVPVTHFTEIRGNVETAEPIGKIEAPAAPGLHFARTRPTAYYPSHVVVYVDQSRIHPRNYPGLVKSLKDFLDAEGVEPERVLVLRQVGGLFVEVPFGSSKAEIEQALSRLSEGAVSGLDLEAETDQALQAIRESWEQSQDSIGSALRGVSSIPDSSGPASTVGGSGAASGANSGNFGVGPDACGPFAGRIQPIIDAFSRSRGQRVAITLANLTDAVSFVAGLPGVKALLYLGDGLATQPAAALASYAGSLCPAAGAELMSGGLVEQMTGPFTELTRHANSNRVTIYSLQASGLDVPGVGKAKSGRDARGGGGPRSRGSFESTHRITQREGLSFIAVETGGRAVFNQNDLAPALAGIGRDLGTYYSLAYSPPAGEKKDAGKERRQHRIEVRLRDKDWTARYRRGYVEKDAKQWLTERIEGALNLGITSNPLEVRLGAGEIRPGDEETFYLPLHVMIPVERLVFLPQGDSLLAEVTLRAMIRSVGSGTMTVQDKTVRVKGAPGATGFASLVMELKLDAGTHVTALGVRDEGSGEASFVSTLLQVGPEG